MLKRFAGSGIKSFNVLIKTKIEWLFLIEIYRNWKWQKLIVHPSFLVKYKREILFLFQKLLNWIKGIVFLQFKKLVVFSSHFFLSHCCTSFILYLNKYWSIYLQLICPWICKHMFQIDLVHVDHVDQNSKRALTFCPCFFHTFLCLRIWSKFSSINLQKSSLQSFP